jgi:hypothetical protein
MQNNFNNEKFVKDIRLVDQLRWLFADMDKLIESKGTEYLLNNGQRNEILSDIGKKKKSKTLAVIKNLYFHIQLAIPDLIMAVQQFQLVTKHLEMVILGISVRSDAEDIINELIYRWSASGFTPTQKENPKVQEKIDFTAEELTQIFVDGDRLYNTFSALTPAENTHKSYFRIENGELEPNILLQKAFLDAVAEAKYIRRKLLELDYMLEKAQINILSDKNSEVVSFIEDELQRFCDFDGHLSHLKFYRSNIDRMKKDPTLKEFISCVYDTETVTQLTEEEQAVVIGELKESLKFGMGK